MGEENLWKLRWERFRKWRNVEKKVEQQDCRSLMQPVLVKWCKYQSDWRCSIVQHSAASRYRPSRINIEFSADTCNQSTNISPLALLNHAQHSGNGKDVQIAEVASSSLVFAGSTLCEPTSQGMQKEVLSAPMLSTPWYSSHLKNNQSHSHLKNNQSHSPDCRYSTLGGPRSQQKYHSLQVASDSLLALVDAWCSLELRIAQTPNKLKIQ